MRNIRNLLPVVAGVLALGGLAAPANALVLTLDDTMGNVVTVNDNGPDDMVAAAGIVTFAGAVGPIWIQNVTTGVSDTILGEVEMDLNSVNVSGGPGTIILTLEDENFMSDNFASVTRFFASIGGTTNGTVETATFIDYSNTVGVLGDQLSMGGPFIGGLAGAFSDEIVIDDVPISGPFGLAIQVTVSHTDPNQISSFNHNFVQVSEPATLSAIGLGMVGLGLAARRRNKRT